MIYLDYSAHTPMDEEVMRIYMEAEKYYIGNPNSKHALGIEAADKMSEVTQSIAGLLNCRADEIIYTSGASESNNLAIKGIARGYRHKGRHIISTALEHPSVGGPLTYLQEQGYEVDLVRIGRDGKIDLESFVDYLREDTILVSLSLVDSELGVVQPISEIADILEDYPNAHLHLDATQAVGKIPVDMRGVDTMSLSAHKFYGPLGIGVLVKNKSLVIEPLIHGGAGTTIYRSGTPALGLAVATQASLGQSISGLNIRTQRVELLCSRLKNIFEKYPQVRINSPDDAIPHILNVSADGVKGVDMRSELSERGVCVSVKSACSTDGTPSKAVFAVSQDKKMPPRRGA